MPSTLGIVSSHYKHPDPVTALLLNADTVTGATDTFKDSSSNNFTITKNGSVSQGTFSPFSSPLSGSGVTYNPSIHGGSAYFDGSSHLTTSASSNLTLGTQNFAVEGWVRPYNTTAEYRCIVADNLYSNTTGTGGWSVYQYGTEIRIFVAGSTLTQILVGVGVLTANEWTHFAWVRNGTTNTLFVNGRSVSTVNRADNFPGTFINISFNNNSGAKRFNGYISDLRIVKGTALYTSNFTRPTAPLTTTSNGGGGGTAPTASQVSLLCNFTNSSIIDSAGKNDLAVFGNASIDTATKKYGTGSLYFDGNGDYLTTPNNTNFNFGTKDFTMECWVNFNSLGTTNQAICGTWWLTNITGWQLYFRGIDGKMTFYINSGIAVQSTASLIAGQWHHIAVSRQASTLRLFVDGVGTSVTNATNIATTNPNFEIGYQSTGTSRIYLNGYIDDLRIIQGRAIYTSDFAVPAGPLSVINKV